MAWELTGNRDTNPQTNFLGTLDQQPLTIRTNNVEHLCITADGSVGVGTTSPGSNARLAVVGAGITVGTAAHTADAAIHIGASFGGFDRLLQMSPAENGKPGLNLLACRNAAGEDQYWAWGVTTDYAWRIEPGTSFSGSAGLAIRSDGNVGIGTTTPGAKLDVAGVIWAQDLVLSSDARLKTDVTPLTGALEKLQRIRGVSFAWADTAQAGSHSSQCSQIGVIAQEVEAVFPELVDASSGTGYQGVNYSGLIGVLVEASKELTDRNRALECKCDSLSKRIKLLETAAMDSQRGGR